MLINRSKIGDFMVLLCISGLALCTTPVIAKGVATGDARVQLSCELTSEGSRSFGAEQLEITISITRDLIQFTYFEGASVRVESTKRFSRNGRSITKDQLNLYEDAFSLLFVDRKSGEFSTIALDAEVQDRSIQYGKCKETAWSGFRAIKLAPKRKGLDR